MPTTVWVATADIYVGSGSSFVLGYTPGNRVPDSVVTSLGLASSGLVQTATIADDGTSPNWRGTDPITRTELDAALADLDLAGAVDSVNGQAGVVVLDADDIADTAAKVFMLPAERTKLAAVAAGATANSTDAQLRDRTTHTGAQAISTVTGLQGALDAKLDTTAAPELIRDTMGTALVAGANVTLTTNDVGDTITVAASGTGGGGATAFVDVMASGAVGDGVANDTTALQTFINANTGKIIVWPEKTFNVSQLLLPSGTHLELGDATIRRTGNTAGAAAGATIRNTDQASGNTNITVRGGIITGNTGASGRPWCMTNVTNLRAQDVQIEKGLATFADWMFVFESCTTVRVDNCRVSGGTAVGEDGLHIKAMQDGVITNCIIESGDDAIALYQEFGQTRPTKHVTISNMVLSSANANALRLGVKNTETFGVEDITLTNIVIRPPASGTPGGTCMTIGDETNTGLLRRVNLSNFVVNATGYAGNAVNISTMMTDSTFTNWRILGASNRSLLVNNCHRLTFNNVVADTPAVTTGNPQWAITGGSTNIHHIGCEVRNSRLWGWTIDGAGSADISFLACRSIASAQESWSVSHVARLTLIGCTVNGGGSPLSCNATNPPSQVQVLGSSFSGYSGNVVVNPPATMRYVGNSDLGNGYTTFADASVGNGSGVVVGQSISNAFTTITLSSENSDAGNNYNPATSIYTVPATGLYLCLGRVRLTDGAGTAGANLGVGIGTASADGPHFQWQTLGAPTRRAFDYQRQARFNAGDQIRLYTYYDATGASVTVSNAQMTVVRVE